MSDIDQKKGIRGPGSTVTLLDAIPADVAKLGAYSKAFVVTDENVPLLAPRPPKRLREILNTFLI